MWRNNNLKWKYKKVSSKLDSKGLYIDHQDFDIMEAIMEKLPQPEIIKINVIPPEK